MKATCTCDSNLIKRCRPMTCNFCSPMTYNFEPMNSFHRSLSIIISYIYKLLPPFTFDSADVVLLTVSWDTGKSLKCLIALAGPHSPLAPFGRACILCFSSEQTILNLQAHLSLNGIVVPVWSIPLPSSILLAKISRKNCPLIGRCTLYMTCKGKHKRNNHGSNMMQKRKFSSASRTFNRTEKGNCVTKLSEYSEISFI